MAPKPKAAARAAQGRQRKREAGLSAQQRNALNIDFLEEEEVKDRRQYLLEDEEEVDAGELPEGFEDEEISSDEDGDMPVPSRKRRADDESEDEQSIGSSVDEEDMADLSTMLNDNDSEDEAPRTKSNASMLQAVGLTAGAGRRRSERVEAREENEYNTEAPGNQLTVDALLDGLGKQKGFGALQKSLAALSDPTGGKRGAARAQLGAPLEKSDQRRVEREAATDAAHREVSKWDEAVRRHSRSSS